MSTTIMAGAGTIMGIMDITMDIRFWHSVQQ